MSADATERGRGAEPREDAASSGSRVNPTNWPDHLRQYQTESPDEPSARETQDPHVWDDPDPSLLEKMAPDTTAGWLLAWAMGLVTLGVMAYLLPIFAGWVLDPLVVGALIVGGILVGTYVKGRLDGIRAYRDLAKSVIYYGHDADVRAGKEAGESGPETLFTVLRDFSWAGFKRRYLLKRDLSYDPGKLRSYPGEDVGEAEAVDALNKTTVEVESDVLGKFYITHASDLDHSAQSTDADRYTPLPDRFDADVAEDVQILVRRLRRKIKELKADAEELERAASDARDLRNKQLAPELEQTLLMINALQSAVDVDEHTNGHTDDSAGLEAIREAAEKSRNEGGWK
jgi:hypothetical protein